MAGRTVDDIPGKDFIFEQEVVQPAAPAPEGTIYAGVGGAHWGAISVPTVILQGNDEFFARFGQPLTLSDAAPDSSGLAMEYHLRKSNLGLFTRVTDGTEAKSTISIDIPALGARVDGTVVLLNQSFVIEDGTGPGTQNNELLIEIDDGGDTAISLTATPFASLDTDELSSATDYNPGEIISVTIDGAEYLRTVQALDLWTSLTTTAAGLPEISTITVSAKASYGVGEWVELWSAGDVTQFSFWFDTTGADGAPAAPGTLVRVDISADVSDNDVAISLAAQIALQPDFTAPVPGAAIVTVTNVASGVTTDVDDSNSANSTGAVTQQGVDPITYATAWRTAALDAGVGLKDGATLIPAADIALITVTVTDDALQFISEVRGAAGSLVVTETVDRIFPSGDASAIGVDTDGATIADEINTDLGVAATAFLDSDTGFLAILSASTGVTSEVEIKAVADDAYTLLGLSVGVTNGTNLQPVGTFEAFYTGEEGDTIQLVMSTTPDGPSLDVFFQGGLIANFLGFSFTDGDINYIVDIFNAAPELQNIVTFLTHNTTVVIPDGTHTLTGGASGITGLADLDYIAEVNKLSNIDLFEFDLIAVSGNSSVPIADALQETCEKRQDCYAIVDPPFGLSVGQVISWHNGTLAGIREKQLDSQFVTTYFPHILLRVNDTPTSQVTEFHAPSVRVIGATAQNDEALKHKFGAPAGIRTTFDDDIEGLEVFLEGADRDRLYADQLGNNINPLGFNIVDGFTIEGQKTTQKEQNALNRINVMRVQLFIKKSIRRQVKFFFWNPADPSSFGDFAAALEKITDELIEKRAIEADGEFAPKVTVDRTTNTPNITEKNGLLGIVEWTPLRTIERIKVISILREKSVAVQFA